MWLLLLTKHKRKSVELGAKRHSILYARHHLDKEKAEPATWDNDSLGIRGNQRGIILGLGKKIVLSFKSTTRVPQ